MLDPQEERKLRLIELVLGIDDARFVAGLREGRPREPREYRRRRYLRAGLAMPVPLLGLLLPGDPTYVLVGVLILVLLVGFIGWRLPP